MDKELQHSVSDNARIAVRKDTAKNIAAQNIPAANAARIILLSAIGSGEGKTTVTAALARKLQRGGLRVRIFKTGPDYLDPMILQRACGEEVYALDLWMVGLDGCRRLLAQAAAQADVILIEGMKGLHDGDPSSADLARALGVPVAIVLDAAKMAESADSELVALQQYGGAESAGVIINRIASALQAQKIASAMPDVPLLATLPQQINALPKRHLGLLQPDEIAQVDEMLEQMADQIELDVAAWNRIPPMVLDATYDAALAANTTPQRLTGKKIAIARDAAFAFVYHANMECLREAGATLQFFSPINDEPVPDDADAVYIPGGYPELHAAALSTAQRWQQSLRNAYASDKPILAECGGMMAVAEQLVDADGKSWPMVGLLPGVVAMQSNLVGLGMQSLTMDEGKSDSALELRGHAFHYSTLTTPLEPIGQTIKRRDGKAGEAVYRHGPLTATYFHAYFSSCPAAMTRFFSAGKSI